MKPLLLAALFTGAAAYGVVSFQGEPYHPETGGLAIHDAGGTKGFARSVEERQHLARQAGEYFAAAIAANPKMIARQAEWMFRVYNPDPNEFVPEVGLALESLRAAMTGKGPVLIGVISDE